MIPPLQATGAESAGEAAGVEPTGPAVSAPAGLPRRDAVAEEVPLAALDWRSSYRLIPTRFPTIGLYDRVADPADLDAVFAIEMLTNPRIRDAIGQLQLVPPAERVSGGGSTLVMAAFTHLNPEGSRFSDGSYGVYYAAATLDTAVAEVRHHRARFLARTREPAMELDLRAIVAGAQGEFHDLRGWSAAHPVLDPAHYGASQALGLRLRAAGSSGVVFPSVRHAGGWCIGAFRPRVVRHAKAGTCVTLCWDGERMTHWYEKRGLREVSEAPL